MDAFYLWFAVERLKGPILAGHPFKQTNAVLSRDPVDILRNLCTKLEIAVSCQDGSGSTKRYSKWVARSANGLPWAKTCGPIPGAECF